MLHIGIFLLALGFRVTFSLPVENEKVTYDGYQVWRVTAPDLKSARWLLELEDFKGAHLFKRPGAYERFADVLVPPDAAEDVQGFVNVLGTTTEVITEDVGSLLRREAEDQARTAAVTRKSKLTWERYNTMEEIYDFLDEIQSEYPSKVKVESIGKTYEERDLKILRMSEAIGGSKTKPIVWIDAGMHAREWITPAAVTWMIQQLLQDPANEKFLKAFEIHIVPVANPDGYAYSHTKDRLWRKNRSPNGFVTSSRYPSVYSRSCYGTDNNRNWDAGFATPGASSNPCSDVFHGGKPFSQPETKAMSQDMEKNKERLKMYLSFHSYSQLLLLPYGFTDQRPADFQQMKDFAQNAIKKLEAVYNTKYRVGNTVDLLYRASGSSMDWAKNYLNVKHSYTFELRDLGKYGFLLPANQIIPTSIETFEAVKQMLTSLEQELYEARSGGISDVFRSDHEDHFQEEFPDVPENVTAKETFEDHFQELEVVGEALQEEKKKEEEQKDEDDEDGTRPQQKEEEVVEKDIPRDVQVFQLDKSKTEQLPEKEFLEEALGSRESVETKTVDTHQDQTKKGFKQDVPDEASIFLHKQKTAFHQQKHKELEVIKEKVKQKNPFQEKEKEKKNFQKQKGTFQEKELFQGNKDDTEKEETKKSKDKGYSKKMKGQKVNDEEVGDVQKQEDQNLYENEVAGKKNFHGILKDEKLHEQEGALGTTNDNGQQKFEEMKKEELFEDKITAALKDAKGNDPEDILLGVVAANKRKKINPTDYKEETDDSFAARYEEKTEGTSAEESNKDLTSEKTMGSSGEKSPEHNNAFGEDFERGTKESLSLHSQEHTRESVMANSEFKRMKPFSATSEEKAEESFLETSQEKFKESLSEKPKEKAKEQFAGSFEEEIKESLEIKTEEKTEETHPSKFEGKDQKKIKGDQDKKIKEKFETEVKSEKGAFSGDQSLKEKGEEEQKPFQINAAEKDFDRLVDIVGPRISEEAYEEVKATAEVLEGKAELDAVDDGKEVLEEKGELDAVDDGKEDLEQKDEFDAVDDGKEVLEGKDDFDAVDDGKEVLEEKHQFDAVDDGKEVFEGKDDLDAVNDGKEVLEEKYKIEVVDDGEEVLEGKDDLDAVDDGKDVLEEKLQFDAVDDGKEVLEGKDALEAVDGKKVLEEKGKLDVGNDGNDEAQLAGVWEFLENIAKPSPSEEAEIESGGTKVETSEEDPFEVLVKFPFVKEEVKEEQEDAIEALKTLQVQLEEQAGVHQSSETKYEESKKDEEKMTASADEFEDKKFEQEKEKKDKYFEVQENEKTNEQESKEKELTRQVGGDENKDLSSHQSKGDEHEKYQDDKVREDKFQAKDSGANKKKEEKGNIEVIKDLDGKKAENKDEEAVDKEEEESEDDKEVQKMARMDGAKEQDGDSTILENGGAIPADEAFANYPVKRRPFVQVATGDDSGHPVQLDITDQIHKRRPGTKEGGKILNTKRRQGEEEEEDYWRDGEDEDYGYPDEEEEASEQASNNNAERAYDETT